MDLFGGEGVPLAGLEAAEGVGADVGSMQGDNGVAELGEGAADLAVAALFEADGEVGAAGIDDAEAAGAVFERNAVGEAMEIGASDGLI